MLWDLTTRAARKGKRRGEQHYWVDIGDNTAETLVVDTIIVRLDRSRNMIRVEKAGRYLRLLVDRRILDLEQPVRVSVGD